MLTATPTVIVVEDEAKIRRFIKLALEAEQLEVFEADVARGLIEVGTGNPIWWCSISACPMATAST